MTLNHLLLTLLFFFTKPRNRHVSTVCLIKPTHALVELMLLVLQIVLHTEEMDADSAKIDYRLVTV